MLNLPIQKKLPDERKAITYKFKVGGESGFLTVGFYPDGRVGEIFITLKKPDQTIAGLLDSFARFDVVSVLSSKDGTKIELIKNAFDLTE